MKPGRKRGAPANPNQKSRRGVDPEGRSANVQGIAVALGINPRTFATWAKLPGFPSKGDDDQWSVPEIREWCESSASNKPANPDYELAKARKMEADASKAEHDLAQRKGELVALADVEREWSQKNSELFQIIDKHFAKIAPKLSGRTPAEILKALKEMMRTAREESAR